MKKLLLSMKKHLLFALFTIVILNRINAQNDVNKHYWAAYDKESNTITCTDRNIDDTCAIISTSTIFLNVPPKYDYHALLKGNDSITIIYTSHHKKTDSLFKYKISRYDVNPIWKPEFIMSVKSKKIDNHIEKMSSNKAYYAYCIPYRISKKSNNIMQIAVIDSEGCVLINKDVKTNYRLKNSHENYYEVLDDGTVILGAIPHFKTKKQHDNNGLVLYTIDNENVSYYHNVGPGYYNHPEGKLLRNGDFIVVGMVHFTSARGWQTPIDFVYMYQYDNEKKVLNYKTKSIPGSLYFGWMYDYVRSPVSTDNFINCIDIYELSDNTIIVILEAQGRSHLETPKTTTSTYKDKNGNTRTATHTTIEYSNYKTYSGDVLVCEITPTYEFSSMLIYDYRRTYDYSADYSKISISSYQDGDNVILDHGHVIIKDENNMLKIK